MGNLAVKVLSGVVRIRSRRGRGHGRVGRRLRPIGLRLRPVGRRLRPIGTGGIPVCRLVYIYPQLLPDKARTPFPILLIAKKTERRPAHKHACKVVFSHGQRSRSFCGLWDTQGRGSSGRPRPSTNASNTSDKARGRRLEPHEAGIAPCGGRAIEH